MDIVIGEVSVSHLVSIFEAKRGESKIFYVNDEICSLWAFSWGFNYYLTIDLCRAFSSKQKGSGKRAGEKRNPRQKRPNFEAGEVHEPKPSLS